MIEDLGRDLINRDDETETSSRESDLDGISEPSGFFVPLAITP